MAKKKKEWGDNSKAVEARGRKAAAQKEAQSQKMKQKEDEYWASAGEGSRSKAQQKKEEQERKKREAAEKRAEARKLAEKEAEQVGSSSKKIQKQQGGPKVTQFQLRKQADSDRAAELQAAGKRRLAARREVEEDTYAQMVDQENTNREEGTVDARNLEQAISQLGVSDDPPEDMHPERRRKAAFKAFEEREEERLREEKPGLKKSQYRDMIFKLWQKSPENPMNRIG